jgi:hypothetical protein
MLIIRALRCLCFLRGHSIESRLRPQNRRDPLYFSLIGFLCGPLRLCASAVDFLNFPVLRCLCASAVDFLNFPVLRCLYTSAVDCFPPFFSPLVFLLFLLFCAPTANVSAADWSFTPSASLSEGYDSNYAFTKPAKGDYVTSFTPVASLTGETENTKFTFNTNTPALAYIDNPRYDTVNTNTTADLTEIWSPRFSTSASLSFVHDQTLTEQLNASGIVSQRTDHFMYNAGLGCTYGLTESINVSVAASYTKSTYPSQPLSDTYSYQTSITPVWAVTELDNIGLSSSYSYSGYATGGVGVGSGTSIQSITEMFFWQRPFSETLSAKLGGGYYISQSDYAAFTKKFTGFYYYDFYTEQPVPIYEVVPRAATATSGGFVFSADINKDLTERLGTAFSAGRQQFSDANARSFDSTYFAASATYRLSELMSATLALRYNTNDQISLGNQKIDFYSINASIQRDLTEHLTAMLTTSYGYEHENLGGPSSIQNLERYTVSANLIYKWPRFLASD